MNTSCGIAEWQQEMSSGMAASQKHWVCRRRGQPFRERLVSELPSFRQNFVGAAYIREAFSRP